jgi:hypothetical protein
LDASQSVLAAAVASTAVRAAKLTAVIVAYFFWLPHFLWFNVGVFSKVQAAIFLWSGWVNGTDEVGVVTVKETAMPTAGYAVGIGGFLAYHQFNSSLHLPQAIAQSA